LSLITESIDMAFYILG